MKLCGFVDEKRAISLLLLRIMSIYLFIYLLGTLRRCIK
jgi:hypothetical protein